MISVENLKVEFGVKPLFSGANFVVNDRDRIALVGKNGAGKSTLLKILCGQQQPTGGVVAIPSDTTVGYLPQVMKLADETTVVEETRKAFADTTRLKAKIDRMERELAERTDYESDEYMALVERFTQEHERYLMLGGENYEAEIERTLLGLGFLRTDFDRPTSEFSGGWRMRIELAKLLLRRPDVLLLDEPTNHLDIESIQWLEQFLATSASAVVLVSHDRAFINNVTNRTLEISCGQIVDYKVKYSEYVVLRKERREQQLRAYENQQKEIADMQAFINRFRYQATKAVQVQQKIKQLEKIVPIEIDEVDNSKLRLKFPPCLRSGDYPIIAEDVKKVYPRSVKCEVTSENSPENESNLTSRSTLHTSQEHLVFENATFTLKRGEKVAFVGKNGEGKTTLVKCIMGEIPFEGSLKIGHNVQIGYFAQNQAQLLDESLTVFQTIDYVARGDIRLRINDILGAFMFGGEESDKRVKVLSGGERSRLAMIRLLLEPVNLLILDEPTNHLDMQSKDVLKEAIRAFDGTAIIVSHDREFLDGLVTKVYEFGGGRVREHLGGIYDWLKAPHLLPPEGGGSKNVAEMTIDERLAMSTKACSVEASKASPTGGGLEGASSYADQKEQQRKLKKAEKAVKACEEKIAQMEAQLKEMDAILMQPEHASDMKLINEYAEIMRNLEAENDRWMTLSEELEALQQ
ncbi:MAG: ABC-F family ATP-binding cassette domain-containing protein [Prevotella sp.]|nr:ABC-F family ATP-binding cassette domain-containing protein [Prevotella sp.]